MTRQNRVTIKSVVFDAIHRTQGTIQYPELKEQVLERFPQSAFQESHWAWYRYQCTKGKYARINKAIEGALAYENAIGGIVSE